ncbi:surface protein, putative [Trichomonas vaginalis G3]|uniref:Surface protein, putative n=1 Tax=Trichomonas vaginalis (strain ATCC PRA-98 / G3) TaxID=412133 RepID=A2FIT5_TRIV3|nr:ribonuclease inhibitor domain-containing protein [Trichomonas vaginalis G3]EAX95188.1 surface protein, putative [Trichomonas vaginalis G3]KAI5516164.1 ribonuclease inhibitor domain-containing protein [Trichomonas vaginalis G3]|eukprot:XP_001308118.1 surface protein [Trichomonas vaginalis G3]
MLIRAAFSQLLESSICLNSVSVSGDVMTIESSSDYTDTEARKKLINGNIRKIIIGEEAEIQAFSGFNYITDLEITSTYIFEIPEKLFYENNIIQTVTLPQNVESIGDYAFAFSSIETINLEYVTSIRKNAFENCHKLSVVSLNQDYIIEEYTIANSGITTISINNCPEYAFFNCFDLRQVTISKLVLRFPNMHLRIAQN